ncbi:MAG: phosphate ABC transporter permease [Acidobacteria bacterium]|nr:MAG: phosphate ABC transporter permease [Acidobacteriota bacterium]
MHKIIRARSGLARLNLEELWEFRELIYFLAWRDVLVRYKQTAIGVLWAVFRPFLTIVVFSVVFGRFAHVPTGTLPYPVLSLAGLLAWQLFSTAFAESSSSVVSNPQLVSKIYFPRMIMPLSAVVASLVDFFVALAMLAVLMIWYRVPLSPSIVWLPLFIFLCLLIALGTGIWFAALYVRYRDIRHLIPFIVQLGLYISPVGFPSSMVPERWRFVYSLNPMVGVIDGFRWSLFGGRNPIYVPGLTISIVLSIAALIGGAYYFRNTERLFADII